VFGLLYRWAVPPASESQPVSTNGPLTTERPESFAALHQALKDNIAQVIQGKDEVIDLVLLCLIAEGHLLLEDVPGVGKTSLAKALARSIDAPFGRIQFTPDLLPSDVVGVNIWLRGAERFELHQGPVFANVVVADEINRASPKTQSALLEAMAERQVTIDNGTYQLSSPFIVLATQNPIEHEGTYALPESQLDRFLMKVSLGYPDRHAELSMLQTHSEHSRLEDIGPVVSPAHVNGLITAARTVHVAPALQGYLVDLAAASRSHPAVSVGVSPRASLALQRVARARAATRGRTYVVPDDVKAVAVPVLAHRILLRPDAQVAGTTAEEVVAELLHRVPVPSSQAATG
jgi:MoxR-like ATPase